MSYLLRGLGRDFERTLRQSLREIKERGKSQQEKFERDKPLFKDLITPFAPLPAGHVFEEDFLVGAVDGSGVAPLLQYEDVYIHLVTANFALYSTNTHGGSLIKSIRITGMEPLPDGGKLTEAFWIPLDEGREKERFMSFAGKVYGLADVNEVLYAFFSEVEGRPIRSIEEIRLNPKFRHVRGVEDLVIFPPSSDVQRVQDHIRWMAEAALAKRALDSQLNLKYLFLDGALTLLMREGQNHPILLPNYMIRDVCARARRKGTVVAAVSKSHSVPCWGLIADLAMFLYGVGSHWFCRLPGRDDPDGRELHILEGRGQIPPTHGVTYLFRFSDEMPVLRVDFDRFWWEENIQSQNKRVQREREIRLFQEIDFLSHDARWYGYPCPLSFAHLLSTIDWESRQFLIERAVTIAKEEGFDEDKIIPFRSRIGI
mgnify:CR=1 FL=1